MSHNKCHFVLVLCIAEELLLTGASYWRVITPKWSTWIILFVSSVLTSVLKTVKHHVYLGISKNFPTRNNIDIRFLCWRIVSMTRTLPSKNFPLLKVLFSGFWTIWWIIKNVAWAMEILTERYWNYFESDPVRPKFSW